MATPEQRAARSARERARYANMTDAEREHILARSRQWKKNRDPEAAAKVRAEFVAAHRERMANDPEFAAAHREKQRIAVAKKRAAAKAEKR